MGHRARIATEIARMGNATPRLGFKLNDMLSPRTIAPKLFAFVVLPVCAAALCWSMLFGSQRGEQPASKAGTRTKPTETLPPFRLGEKLDYRILYSKFSLQAATAQLAVPERRDFHGRQAWHFQAFAHTVDTMRALFPLDDQFDSYTDAASLSALQFEMHIHEQGKKEDHILRLRTGADPAPSGGPAVQVLPETRDALGFVFFLRTVDWSRRKEVRCPVFDGKKLYEARSRLEYEDSETTVPVGKYRASRIEIRVFERDREVPQTRFWVWLARDTSRIPVLLEADLPIGSARIELTHAQ